MEIYSIFSPKMVEKEEKIILSFWMYNNLGKTICSSPDDGLKTVNYYDCKLVMIKKLCSSKILISPNVIWKILEIPYIVN